MRRLRKFLALTPAGRTLVLHSLLLLPAVALSLHARGMVRTRAALGRLGRRGAGKTEELAPGEVARLVDAAASALRVRCLPRSLVLWHFVRDRSRSVEVRLGVSKLGDGSLYAHAWLEFDGLPLNERADVFERYAVLPPLPEKPNC